MRSPDRSPSRPRGGFSLPFRRRRLPREAHLSLRSFYPSPSSFTLKNPGPGRPRVPRQGHDKGYTGLLWGNLSLSGQKQSGACGLVDGEPARSLCCHSNPVPRAPSSGSWGYKRTGGTWCLPFLPLPFQHGRLCVSPPRRVSLGKPVLPSCKATPETNQPTKNTGGEPQREITLLTFLLFHVPKALNFARDARRPSWEGRKPQVLPMPRGRPPGTTGRASGSEGMNHRHTSIWLPAILTPNETLSSSKSTQREARRNR